MEILSRADEILLLAILRLEDDAYGVTIVKEIQKRTGKTLKLGGLWVSLDILTKKGYVDKSMGDPTPRRGGRSKIYYTLTREGLQALDILRNFNRSLWMGIPEAIKNTQI
jgi:PadR family transcriptional regulator, regulatory protein PadR